MHNKPWFAYKRIVWGHSGGPFAVEKSVNLEQVQRCNDRTLMAAALLSRIRFHSRRSNTAYQMLVGYAFSSLSVVIYAVMKPFFEFTHLFCWITQRNRCIDLIFVYSNNNQKSMFCLSAYVNIKRLPKRLHNDRLKLEFWPIFNHI